MTPPVDDLSAFEEFPPSLPDADLPVPRFDRELSLTDDGNARRFVRDWGTSARYVHGIGWYLWRRTHWEPDGTELVVEMARKTATRILLEAGVAGEQGATEKEEAALTSWAKRSRSAAALSSMLTLARSDNAAGIAARAADLDSDGNLLNTVSGTIDLRTGECRDHRREDLLTHCVRVPYDPAAQCPRWERFLLEVFAGDVELATWIQRAIGYTLTGETNEQSLFLLYGKGSNGKTTFLEILRQLLGGSDEPGGRRSLAISVSFETLLAMDARRGGGGPSEDLARLVGRRLAIAIEPDAGRRLNEARIKTLTGEDTISARYMYKGTFEFLPVAKLWLGCNKKPIIQETDHGTWRRMKLVPFERTFPKNPGLRDELKAELPGILRFAIDGCRQWRAAGLGDVDAVSKATAAYREGSDTLGEFLEDRCTVDAAEWCSSSDLYATYKRWSEERGDEPLKQRTLAMRLEERPGITRERKTTARGWRGVGVSGPRLLVGIASDAS